MIISSVRVIGSYEVNIYQNARKHVLSGSHQEELDNRMNKTPLTPSERKAIHSVVKKDRNSKHNHLKENMKTVKGYE